MAKYGVSIEGLVDVDADSPEQAIQIVKEKFKEEQLTIDDLWLGIDYEEGDS